MFRYDKDDWLPEPPKLNQQQLMQWINWQWFNTFNGLRFQGFKTSTEKSPIAAPLQLDIQWMEPLIVWSSKHWQIMTIPRGTLFQFKILPVIGTLLLWFLAKNRLFHDAFVSKIAPLDNSVLEAILESNSSIWYVEWYRWGTLCHIGYFWYKTLIYKCFIVICGYFRILMAFEWLVHCNTNDE